MDGQTLAGKVYDLTLESGECIRENSLTMPRQLLERAACGESNAVRFELMQAYFDFCNLELSVEMSIPELTPLVRTIEDAETQAGLWLLAGVLLEKRKRFAAAAMAYRQGYVLEPCRPDVWYFMNNNLGFCLIQVGAFVEAEGFCRTAIRIDPARANAYKNCGLALQGQGRFAEAARSFIDGILAFPEDQRSLHHLHELIEANPQVESDLPGIEKEMARCDELVRQACE
jgi:tetratricopeptide (TPR) repeat protein